MLALHELPPLRIPKVICTYSHAGPFLDDLELSKPNNIYAYYKTNQNHPENHAVVVVVVVAVVVAGVVVVVVVVVEVVVVGEGWALHFYIMENKRKADEL